MLDKLCLVMDIDETMVHYTENDVRNFTASDLFDGTASIIHRPGLKEFFDFVKSYSPDNVFKSVSTNAATASADAATVSSTSTKNNKSIVLGIWTYGTRRYADEVVRVLKATYAIDFEFVYSRETMQENPDREEKELEFILENHGQELGLEKDNIYLVDNCPSNVYHHKNIKNSILVTSFVGTNIDKRDKMFPELIGLCKELLYEPHVSKKYINKFTLNGVPTNIISIGKNGIKAWDSDDSCSLYIRDEFENYGGSPKSGKQQSSLGGRERSSLSGSRELRSLSAQSGNAVSLTKRRATRKQRHYTRKHNKRRQRSI